MNNNEFQLQSMSGEWIIEKDPLVYKGELHFNEKKHTAWLELVIKADDGDPMPSIHRLGEMHYIQGTLIDGAKVVLYGCRTGRMNTQVWSHTTQIIYCDYIFWGLEIESENDLVFRGAVIDFGDVLSWYDLCALSWITKDGAPGMSWNQKSQVEMIFGDSCILGFYPHVRLKGNVYDRKGVVEQSVKVKIEYSHDVLWERVMEDIKKTQYLISLGIGHRAVVELLKYEHRSLILDLPIEKTENSFMEATVIVCDGNDKPTRRAEPYSCLFRLKDFLDIPDAAEKWINNYEKLKPVFDLQFSVYKGVGTNQNAFLYLIQALETLHARFVTNSMSKYTTRVDEMMGKVKNPNSKQLWNDFLYGSDQKGRKSIILKSRLADLAYDEGNIPFREIASKQYIQKLVDTRNYFTHYSERKKDKAFSESELPDACRNLLLLLQYHIMRIIGFESNFIINRFRDVNR